MRIMKEAQHSNGLVIGVPEGYEAKQRDAGFVVEPEGDRNSQVRRPIAAYVSLVMGKELPRDSPLLSKSLDGKEVRYHVSKDEGGSGGEVHTLNAFESVPGGYIECSQATQTEHGEPDFALCWSLIKSAKYGERRKD